MNTPLGGGEGSSSGRYGGVRKTSPDTILGEVRTHLQNQGREIGEIKKKLEKLDEVSDKVTAMTALLPHLVTKEHCAESRNTTVRDMKDRMDGKSEITGMNITLPELWDKAARYAAEEKSGSPAVPPPVHGFVYYVKLTASILSLIGVLIGMTAFVFKTMQRQERTDAILRVIERNIPAKAPASAPAQTLAPIVPQPHSVAP